MPPSPSRGRRLDLPRRPRNLFYPPGRCDPVQRASSVVDYALLSGFLRALSIPNRLELLRLLQVPHTPSEISIRPFRRDPAHNPARPISRQAVEAHLHKLQELGFVHSRAARREGRPAREYALNHARLFVVADELRRLSLVRANPGGATATGSPPAGADVEPPALPASPCLVLVSGPLEGRAVALEGAGPWVVGRDPGLDVSLPYDPFVSKRNTRISREGGAFHAQSLPGARNGTRLNWRPLGEDEAAPLRPGDTLGVGRSLLVFRPP